MEYIIISLLVLFSALFSGLTIGFLGLDLTELQRKAKLKNKKAVRILKIRKDGNFLLVVLLLGNVLVNSVLSVFLGQNFSGIVAVIVSTALIVVFGEILPQAVFYRHALSVGYYFVPVVKFFSILFFPIAYPIGKILDYFLGKEKKTIWSRKEIKEIIKTHESSTDSDIDKDEEEILLGALTYSNKKVKKIMTPKSVCFLLEEKDLLDKNLIFKIKKTGFTRIPVFKENIDNIIGVLNAKSLIGQKDKKTVSDLYFKHKIFSVNEDDNLDNLLNKFIKKKSHIAYVTNTYGTFLGIVTMEDIIEEIISKEIVDETDNFIDLREESKKSR